MHISIQGPQAAQQAQMLKRQEAATWSLWQAASYSFRIADCFVMSVSCSQLPHIAPDCASAITPPWPHPPPAPLHCLPSDAPYSAIMLAEVVTSIKRLKENKPPGVCNRLPEMLKCGVDSVPFCAVESYHWH